VPHLCIAFGSLGTTALELLLLAPIQLCKVCYGRVVSLFMSGVGLQEEWLVGAVDGGARCMAGAELHQQQRSIVCLQDRSSYACTSFICVWTAGLGRARCDVTL
jgi:hypothetical protein